MKKHIQVFLILLWSVLTVSAQTTATDFTANDCNGTSHHLFAELDAGKIIVISFVMPCGACIGPSLSAMSTVQNYASSNPGRVVFYIADDIANTNCSSLTGWRDANSMSNVVCFSNTAVTETNYGSGGMPKIVVLGGTNHAIYFTQNGGVNTTNLTNAINSALTFTGISEVKKNTFQLSVFPNPVSELLSVTYVLSQTSDVTFDIYNMLGAKVKTIFAEKQSPGKHEAPLDFENMSNGIYFLKITAGGTSEILKLTVSH